MIELLISETTRMGSRTCVLGLETINLGFRSVRPVPAGSVAWQFFPYRRGDRVAFELSDAHTTQPHVEDRVAGGHRKLGSATENELVTCLRQAEVGRTIKDLFGCQLHLSPKGGDAVYARPHDATRSICGCDVEGISFSFKFYPPKIRASLALASKETLHSLPVVDRGLIDFVEDLAGSRGREPNLNSRLERFFNSVYKPRIMSSPIKFARIGIARPDEDGFCWLMLDSLFPLVQREWQREFRQTKSSPLRTLSSTQ
jgi:hypothetical protein